MTKYVYDFPKLPETATVSYFDETEWNKDLMPQEVEQREIFYEMYLRDLDLYGPQCGPGFLSWAAKVAITTGAGIVLGPAAIPVGAVVWGGGEYIKSNADDCEVREAFGFVSDCGKGTFTGGCLGVAAQGAGAVAGFNRVAGLGKNCEGLFNSAIHGIKVGGTIEFWTSKGFEGKDALIHVIHKEDGIEYKVGCKVCES